MDLDTVTLSKVSQTKPNAIWYRLNVESKKCTNEPIYKTKTESQIDETNMVTKGEREQAKPRDGDWHIHATYYMGFPAGASSKEPICQCGKHRGLGFNPWVCKTPWRTKWQPTPVFLPGEPNGQRSLVGYSPQGWQRVGHDWSDLAAHYSI